MYQIISTIKVNIKSLAAEAVIIRKQEKTTRNIPVRNSLHEHRVGKLRKEARHTQLALAALRNKSYSQIEKNAKTEPDWKKIIQKIKNHTNDEAVLAAVKSWCETAKSYWLRRIIL